MFDTDLGSGKYDVFSLSKKCLFNKTLIAKSADGFVFHSEFSHGVNLYFTALL